MTIKNGLRENPQYNIETKAATLSENKETVSSVDSTIVDILPYGIPKESVIYDSESGLYLAWQPYEENDYFSERYQTTLTEVKCDTIWASVDAKEWAKIQFLRKFCFSQVPE